MTESGASLFVTGGSGFIGTNLLGAWADQYERVCNFSLDPPLDRGQKHLWQEGDILDEAVISAAIENFQPTVVIHMAGRTDCDESVGVEEGYANNTLGTRHVVNAVKNCSTVQRLIVVSSQFVCRPGHHPANDQDFNPETVYGESKAITEKITRELNPDCIWTIVRPTNIWGPWHLRYAREFWRICERGWYFHPAVPSPVRSYGYVGNVIWQMQQLLKLPGGDTHQKVFYVGDQPRPIIEWIEGFHRALSGRRKMLSVPFLVLQSLAKVGDGISLITGRPFYITSSRLRSMITEYATPMERTFELLGMPPSDLKQGIEETVSWYRDYSSRPGSRPV